MKGSLTSAANEVQSSNSASPLLDDLSAMHLFLKSLPEEWPVYLSNSLIPRDAGILSPLFSRRTFVSHRGAAGIDGILSSAVGYSMGAELGAATGTELGLSSGVTPAAPGTPNLTAGAQATPTPQGTAVLIGDIAFLHDSNALLLHRSLKGPVVVGLINNGGGTIFRALPIHSAFPDIAMETFETPQQVDISSLCKAHGIHHTRITAGRGQNSLETESLPAQFTEPGLHVIEFFTDPSASYEHRDRIRTTLKRALVDSTVGSSL